MSNALLQAGRVRGGYPRAISHPGAHMAQGALRGRDRLAAAMRPVVHRAFDGASTGTVVDVGGGTAQARALRPSGWRYIAVDNDERLAGDQTDGMERITGSASGRHPRPESRLSADLSSVFDVVSVDRLRLPHHCIVVRARQKR
ncbi:hypothetical protein [Blastococcus goldschmidtiae]|uniref:Methyltransferase domain-containing protein n=1 Tax=Blastococcus goldschmidtiae TaxID=3075546 RepID=A0ABU2K7W5_9ACTN|nr:hypothetical protein [Blastococcus sp. DSM 46792]MDT0276278.1 hypothetical protein [Blastococcus sp. DSM 46792]